MKRWAGALATVVACVSEPPPAAIMVPAPSSPPSASSPEPSPPSSPPTPEPIASPAPEPEPPPSPTATPLGRLGSHNRSPTLRQGTVTVSGKLPPEVIQRIVRQNFGRFRLCYENGLRTNATLGGTVTVKLVIDPTGAVKSANDGGSSLPDGGVVACVVKGFSNLSFPSPESGMVTVTYPIVFTPP